MLKAARSGNPAPSSSFASLERSLDRTIEFLTKRAPTPEVKALLIEARKLRSVVANWRSIPPPPDVHDEMLDRVLLLSTQAGAERTDAPHVPDAPPTPDAPHVPEIDDSKTEVDSGIGSILEGPSIEDEDTQVYTLDFEPRLYSLEGEAPPEPVKPPAAGQSIAYAPYPPAQDSPYAVYPPAPGASPDAAPLLQEPSEAYPPLQAYPQSPPVYPAAPYPAPPAAGVTPTTGRRAIHPAGEPPVDDAPVAPPTAITVHAIKLPDTLDPDIVLLSDPYSDRADAYRALRRKLASTSDPRVVAVTSPGPGEGKTTTAINLALAMREGSRGKVLLLEANVRSPRISKVLGFEPPACFVEQIKSHSDDPRLPWIVVEVLPQLHVLAVDPKIQHARVLDAIAFASTMERLKLAGYDHIVVDTPQVIGSFEVNMIADTVSGVLFSVIKMKSKKSAIKKAIEQVMPAPVLGVIVLDA